MTCKVKNKIKQANINKQSNQMWNYKNEIKIIVRNFFKNISIDIKFYSVSKTNIMQKIKDNYKLIRKSFSLTLT